MRWGSVLFIGTALSACSLFTPIGSDLTSDQPDGGSVSETGASSSGGSSSGVNGDGDSGGDANAPNDAGSDSSADVTIAKCTSGDIVKAFRAFDATPTTPTGLGPTCNPNGALENADNQVAGLDRGSTADTTIDGKDAVSCVGVEVAQGVEIAAVIVRAQAATSACGASPCISNATGCGTGRSFSLYVGETLGTLKLIKDGADVGSALATNEYPVSPTVTGRLIVACRASWGLERDDIAIDFLAARCR